MAKLNVDGIPVLQIGEDDYTSLNGIAEKKIKQNLMELQACLWPNNSIEQLNKSLFNGGNKCYIKSQRMHYQKAIFETRIPVTGGLRSGHGIVWSQKK